MPATETEPLPHFNDEHHIWLEDAKKIKQNVALNEELIFPLETKEDYGRIAAQTAKQVIIQRIREAEKVSVMEEYSDRQGTILNGKVQKVERGNVLVTSDAPPPRSLTMSKCQASIIVKANASAPI